MKILELRCLNGPNYWSVRRHKLVVMKLDLEALEEQPTNQIPGFYERIKAVIPSLYEHQCSEGHPGGFFERVYDGTWMGHVIEHIALEIQTLAGMECGFGRTRGTGQYGVYNVVFSYEEERPGLYAAEAAVRIAQALVDGTPYNLEADAEALRQLHTSNRLGPSTGAIVRACVAKGIPYLRLNNDSYVQLGYGAAQKRIEATVTSQTSAIAVELAADKHATKQALEAAGVPVPPGTTLETEDELLRLLKQLPFPWVVKPLDGNHGRGVTIGVDSPEQALDAFRRAKGHSDEVLVEKMIPGNDYRLLLVDYRLCAVAQRVPARVVGDGVSTIQQLIDEVNRDSRRGEGHEKILTRITVDEVTRDLLCRHSLTLDAVLPADQVLFLKKTANLSTGGTSVDLTDQVHPEIRAMAERTARAIGLDVCGIDLIAQAIDRPLRASGAAVIEVNAGPGLRMHTHPTEGQPRDVGQCVAEMLFPDGEKGRIPLIAITGTNGKTTTTRLTAHVMMQTGRRVGFTTTDGIYIDDHQIEEGDCTGPVSTRKVLRDASVQVAVLECARGGMLRSGLAFDQCDVGVVTNVAADHLGLRDINTVEDMARVKGIVAESVKSGGYAVLNADNEHTYGLRERVRSHVALFSLHPDSERIQAHCQAGGLAALVQDGHVVIRQGENQYWAEPVRNIPLAFGGKAPFMLENILAATLAAYCQGVPVETIAAGLRSFEPSFKNTPGRMNEFCFGHFRVMVDYAHNPHGLSALGQFLSQTFATRKVGILTGVGDRRDEDIRELGRVAAGLFDELIVRFDDDTRGRCQEVIADLLGEGVRSVDPAKLLLVIADEADALRHAIAHAQPGYLVVLLSDRIVHSVGIVRAFQEQETKTGLQPA